MLPEFDHEVAQVTEDPRPTITARGLVMTLAALVACVSAICTASGEPFVGILLAIGGGILVRVGSR